MQLTQDDIDRWVGAKAKADACEQKIIDRMRNILELIGKFFNYELGCWYFHDAPEGGMGTLEISTTIEYVSEWVEKSGDHKTKEKLATKDWDYRDAIPADFLTMSDEEILGYLQNDLDEHKKTEKENLKQQALSKLSNAERKALGL